LVADLNGLKRIFEWKYLNFLKDRNLKNDSRVYIKWIWTQGLEYFKIEFRYLIWRRVPRIMKIRWKGFEFWLEIWIRRKRILTSIRISGLDLAQKMKFKSRDLDSNEFPILERFRPFLNRKFGIWSKGSKFKPMALNQGYFKIQGKDLNFRIKKI
jgi:hypothetical protein